MEEDMKLIDDVLDILDCKQIELYRRYGETPEIIKTQDIINAIARLQKENELAKETIKNHCADMDKMNQRLYELKTENENITRELLARTNKLNDLLEERKQLKDKMIGDKMEQFDDYIIYLIESYLDTMGDK